MSGRTLNSTIARSHTRTPLKEPTNSIARMGFERVEDPSRVQGIPQERVPSGDFAEGESDKEC